jgi:hypothetical protein
VKMPRASTRGDDMGEAAGDRSGVEDAGAPTRDAPAAPGLRPEGGGGDARNAPEPGAPTYGDEQPPASPQLASPQLASERSQPSEDSWGLGLLLTPAPPLSAHAQQPPASPQRSAAVTEVMDELEDEAGAPVAPDVGFSALVPRGPSAHAAPSAGPAADPTGGALGRSGAAALQPAAQRRPPPYPSVGARPSRGQLLLAAASGLITPPPGQPRAPVRPPAPSSATMVTPAAESALRRAWHAAQPSRGFTPPQRPKIGAWGPPGRGGLGGAPVGARAARMLLAAEEAMRGAQAQHPGGPSPPRPAASLLATLLPLASAPALRTPATHAKETVVKSAAAKRPLANSQVNSQANSRARQL